MFHIRQVTGQHRVSLPFS